VRAADDSTSGTAICAQADPEAPRWRAPACAVQQQQRLVVLVRQRSDSGAKWRASACAVQAQQSDGAQWSVPEVGLVSWTSGRACSLVT
jgi:hypothetical protein